MKSIFQNFLLAGLALAVFTACEKDEDRLVLRQQAPATLTSTAQSVTLTSADAAKPALTLTWTPPNYGYSNAAVAYALQVIRKGAADTIMIDNGTSLSKSFTVGELNALMLRAGVQPGTQGQVDISVKSTVVTNTSPARTNFAPAYSNSTTITGTPFSTAPTYPTALYVPGAYQGWSPDKASSLTLVNSDGSYEGYIYFAAASEFKLTSAPNWDNTNYGTGGVGKLSTTGGNLSIDSPGYYLMRVDLGKQTWTATKTQWGIVGAATPKGWDASTPMTYDATSNTWKVTLDLKADDFKFRANDAWDINFGDTKADGILDAGGDNIKVPAAGKYLVTLDLSKAGKYTYTLTKQ
ncbi:SusE domain-containing protein [Spirosoma soli]|uniref:SusE domain-containing protein n=1 Tax=Spirosoma soli TaxID=1770529 RepID=A0ABW5MG03_9BACT